MLRAEAGLTRRSAASGVAHGQKRPEELGRPDTVEAHAESKAACDAKLS